ncbi:MAG: hypothetical protein BGO29_01235 [Bacteroidales bacterium 36-12]|jgi:hypothetical protein|nr:MAG: hypothetical protein BGO29_01235 [Bacteroidales bacterium 36-12]
MNVMNLCKWLLLGMFVILLACNSNTNKPVNPDKPVLTYQDGVYTIDLNQLTDVDTITIHYSSIVEKIEIIALENQEGALMGNINKMQISDDTIFILDTMIAKKILVFNMDGKYIQQIGKFGRGPGEYLQIMDFTVNEKDKQIVVLDVGNKIHTYSIHTGEYLRTLNFENDNIGVYAIQYANDKLYAAIRNFNKDNQSCMLLEMDYHTGEQTKQLINESANNKAFNTNFNLNNSPFIQSAVDKPVFNRPFMDTVFAVRNEGVFFSIYQCGRSKCIYEENRGFFQNYVGRLKSYHFFL